MPKRRVYLETSKVERGKPHEWETQILVGESDIEEMNCKMKQDKNRKIDKWLPPKKVQNMAY